MSGYIGYILNKYKENNIAKGKKFIFFISDILKLFFLTEYIMLLNYLKARKNQFLILKYEYVKVKNSQIDWLSPSYNPSSLFVIFINNIFK